MKPRGVAIGMDASMRVLHPSRTEDKVWEAVQEAILEGWTPQRFRREVASAWEEAKKRELQDDLRVLRSGGAP